MITTWIPSWQPPTSTPLATVTMSATTTATASAICSQQLQDDDLRWVRFKQLQNVHISGITFISCTMIASQTATSYSTLLFKSSVVDKAKGYYGGVVEFSSSSVIVDQYMSSNNTGSFNGAIHISSYVGQIPTSLSTILPSQTIITIRIIV